jgi:hypothetical protein
VIKCSIKVASFFNIIVMCCMTGITLYHIEDMTFGMESYLTLFLWGLQDGCVNTQSYSMLGTQFETQSDPFIIFNLVQSLSSFVFLLIEGMIFKNDLFKGYTYFITIFGIICLVFSTLFFRYIIPTREKMNFSDIMD